MSALLITLAVGQFTFVTTVFIVIGLLPAMSAEFHLPISTVAQAVGLFSLVYALSAPILSAAAGTMNRRRLLIATLMLFTLSNIVAALTTNFHILLWMRMLGGACDGFYAATATAIAAAMASEHHRGRALSVVNSGITIAFVVGVPLGTYLAYALGWRAAFWFLAGLGTIATIGLAWSLPAEVRLSKVTSLGQRVAILLTPSVLLLVAVTILSYAGVFTIYTYLAPALRVMTGLSGGALSSVLLIFGLTSIVGNWVGGVLTDLSSPARTMLVSFVCLAAILLFFPVMMASTASAVLLVGVVGFLHYTALTPLQHRFTLVQPEQCDVVIGLCFSAFYIGIAAASYIGGYVVANYGVADLGYAASGLKLAAAGALLLSLARHRLVQPATVATVATPRP